MNGPPDESAVAAALREFLASRIVDPGVPFDEETRLDEIGIDSVSYVEILLFIERRFGIAIPDRELTRENLGTLAALARCTRRIAVG